MEEKPKWIKGFVELCFPDVLISNFQHIRFVLVEKETLLFGSRWFVAACQAPRLSESHYKMFYTHGKHRIVWC